MIKTIRLPKQALEVIGTLFRKYFLEKDTIWLFGSRVDPNKRGGDIDLYIETNISDYAIAVDKKISFLCELKKEIGDQKIDVVLNLITTNDHLPIYEVAKSEGVQLA